MKRVRVKICGVRRSVDAVAAAGAGADAIGLVFYKDSPRAVSIDQAQKISQRLPPFVSRVALFLDPSAAEVQTVIDRVRPDLLQFHGSETPAFCGCFGTPYMKAVPMGEDEVDLSEWAEAFHDAHALLLDAHRAGDAGGQGNTFVWQADPDLPAMPIVVAGGLDADNVDAAIQRFAPYAVDVSSGVESGPGIKDAERMHAFVDAVFKATPQAGQP